MSPPSDSIRAGYGNTPEKNPGAFYAYVQGLQWSADPNSILEGDFDCKGTCPGSTNDKAHLVFVPTVGSPNLDWIEALKGKSEYPGEVVVKVTNESNWEYGPLNLPRNTTAYLWVGKNASLKPKKPVFYLSTTTEARRLKRSEFNFCPYATGTQPPKVAIHGQFGVCPTMMVHTDSAAFIPDDPVWVSCGGGCCQNQF